MVDTDRGMPRFDERDIGFLAVALPDEIAFFKYSGDFDGELDAIKRYREKKNLPGALLRRLEIEEVIAAGMRSDYRTDFDGLLARLRRDCPSLTRTLLSEIVDRGFADYIRKNGVAYFQNSAAANIKKTCGKLLFGEKEDPAEAENRRRGIRLMREKGYRAAKIEVSFRLTVDDDAQRNGRKIRVHLPYPAETKEQTQIRLLDATHDFYISDSAHRTAFIETDYTAGDEFGIDYSYILRVPYFDPDPASAKQGGAEEFLREKFPHIRFTPLIMMTAAELAGREKNPLILARRAYDFVTKNVVYSYMRHYLYLDNIPEFALMNRRGDCGVQALLFITLCRAMGVPAAWESGFYVTPDGVGSHDWARFYVAPWGWMYADPSFGGAALRNGDEDGWNYYFCNLDVCRQINCTDFQSLFEPRKNFMRCDPYDNQTGEAEYDCVGLGFGETDCERRTVSFEELV